MAEETGSDPRLVELRLRLATARASRVSFHLAWALGTEALLAGVRGIDRDIYSRALRATREAWEAAYTGRPSHQGGLGGGRAGGPRAGGARSAGALRAGGVRASQGPGARDQGLSRILKRGLRWEVGPPQRSPGHREGRPTILTEEERDG